MANNDDFVKEKERKEAMSFRQFAIDENIRFDTEFTKIDQYDHSKTINFSNHNKNDDDDDGPKGVVR